jgi:exodeoxyribonuclease V alpha subunit
MSENLIKIKTTIETIRVEGNYTDKQGKRFYVFTILANSINNPIIKKIIKPYHRGMRNRHLIIVTVKTSELVEKNQNIELHLTEQQINNIHYSNQYFNYVIEASNLIAVEDMTIAGFERYLCSNYKGIGPALATKVSSFMVSKNATEENILNMFKELILSEDIEIKKLFKKKFDTIYKQISIQNSVKEDNVHLNEQEKIFCSKYNINYNFLLRLKKELIKSMNKKNKSSINDANILTYLKKTPYFLAIDDTIKGFGFKSIDEKVKRFMGKDFKENHEFRMQRFLGYLQFVLLKAEEQGHLYLTYDEIYKAFSDYNNSEEEFLHFDVDTDLFYFKERVQIYIDSLKKNDTLNPYYFDDNLVSTYNNYYLELNISQMLHDINKNKINNDGIDINNELSDLEKEKQLQLSDEQKDAVLNSISSPVSIITGGPGTGKTTISQMLISLLKKMGKSIKVLAPTGTAAKRISSVIGEEAMTIHRGLEFKGYFTRNHNNPLEEDVVIVDESSMIDTRLAKALLSACPNSQVIFIGDVNQLPSVGAGDFLRDIISSNQFNLSHLTKIFRQAEGNPIIKFAYKVNEGASLKEFFGWFTDKEDIHNKFSILSKSSYKRIINDEKNVDWLNNMLEDTKSIGYRQYILHKDLMDVQILVANNRSNGVINSYLQEKLNGENDFIPDTIFKVDDKVIQVKNNYKLEIFNGTIGKIVKYDKFTDIITIDIGDSIVEMDRLVAKKEMQLCYAMTIHKSQGQEFKTVIMLVNDFMLNSRELIYTGATRAKENLKVISNPMLLQSGIAKSNQQGSKNFRNTRLVEFLTKYKN